ncbi:hypothetical protein M1I95_04340 [Rossellomorea marisflavi]|uniref:hypothetical protein n=1 Tax=Rossellomorea marisflavi TaxID=189381 RepID=UPI00279DC4AD|nr:hypothetical protein [Rossellomorea marisflavi]UTE73750.1 hypothetical protein M1I95_04340 [Rossellomorea marisflavi]
MTADGKEYIIIDDVQASEHYAITHHSFTLSGKEYSGHTNHVQANERVYRQNKSGS